MHGLAFTTLPTVSPGTRPCMPVVIEALESRYGRTKDIRYFHQIAQLPQTEETIRWVVGELSSSQPRAGEGPKRYLIELSRLLCNAELGLVVPHIKTIQNAPGFDGEQGELLAYHWKLQSLDKARHCGENWRISVRRARTRPGRATFVFQ